MLKWCAAVVLFGFVQQGTAVESADSLRDSLNPPLPDSMPPEVMYDSLSEWDYQIDSIKSLLGRTKKIIENKLEDISRIIQGKPDSSGKSLEFLEGQIHKKFLKLTKNQEVPLIKCPEVMRRLNDSNLVLIDVRQPEEQAVSIIPGALSPEQFAQAYNRPELLKNKLIVTYCTIGYRSGIYAGELLKKRLDVKNLEGGLLSWSLISGPLVRMADGAPADTVKAVHVYDQEWNLLNPEYEAIW